MSDERCSLTRSLWMKTSHIILGLHRLLLLLPHIETLTPCCSWNMSSSYMDEPSQCALLQLLPIGVTPNFSRYISLRTLTIRVQPYIYRNMLISIDSYIRTWACLIVQHQLCTSYLADGLWVRCITHFWSFHVS